MVGLDNSFKPFPPLLQESSKTTWLCEELNFEGVYIPMIAGQILGLKLGMGDALH